MRSTGSASKRGCGDREAEEVEGFVEIGGERAQVAVERVRVGVEGEIDAQVLKLRLEGARIEVAGAFVEKPRHQVGEPGLAFRVLRRAAAERDVHGDDRDRVVLHQPGLEPARAGDLPGRWRRARAG